MEGSTRELFEQGSAEAEYRMVRPDGQVRWLLDRKAVVRNETGHVIRIGGIVTDITERKQAEEEIRRLSEFLESIIDNASVWLHVRAIDHRVLVWNTAAENISGYSKEEVVGSDQVWENLYPEEAYREWVKANTVRVMEKGETLEGMESTIRCKDGTQRTIAWYTRSLKDGSGTPIGLVGLGWDVTEEKKLQAQLLQVQKIEAVGQLAGGVAHDFNNMLQTILGYSELALDQAKADGLLRQSLLEIRKAAERSAALTRQLLAFARKQTISPQVVYLNDTIRSMVKILQRLIGEDIDLAWIPGHNLWEVNVDPFQVDQMLTNLVVNARDAIGGVGKVTIETGNVVLDKAYCAARAGFVPGEYVFLTVRDDGRGMDKEILEHLFEPFFTTKEAGKGTGLGLATVYGIVKQNNGLMEVQSEPGKGSVFLIYLPRFRGKTADDPG